MQNNGGNDYQRYRLLLILLNIHHRDCVKVLSKLLLKLFFKKKHLNELTWE